MRRAWVAPPGDEHEPSGDPERDRIVNAARSLHMRNGVLATTWPEIAELAGVPVAAVSEHFPAVEDLVPACGGLSWRLLRFPPPEVAAELFAGEELDERMRLLVERIFDVYERAAPSLELLAPRGPQPPGARARPRHARGGARRADRRGGGRRAGDPADARARRPLGLARAARRGSRSRSRSSRAR